MAARKGFACLTPERRREIARAGGKAAHAKGTGHIFTSEEAREAGRKGGRVSHAKRVGVHAHLASTPDENPREVGYPPASVSTENGAALPIDDGEDPEDGALAEYYKSCG